MTLKHEFKKVHFGLDVEDGFPPISVETLNCVSVGGNLLRVDNTPFFVTGVALGDVISCSQRSTMNGCWFDMIESESGNKALSIIFIDDQAQELVYQKLKSFGCYSEYGEFGDLAMLAVCIDKSVNYEKVIDYIGKKEGEEQLSYAELCTS